MNTRKRFYFSDYNKYPDLIPVVLEALKDTPKRSFRDAALNSSQALDLSVNGNTVLAHQNSLVISRSSLDRLLNEEQLSSKSSTNPSFQDKNDPTKSIAVSLKEKVKNNNSFRNNPITMHKNILQSQNKNYLSNFQTSNQQQKESKVNILMSPGNVDHRICVENGKIEIIYKRKIDETGPGFNHYCQNNVQITSTVNANNKQINIVIGNQENIYENEDVTHNNEGRIETEHIGSQEHKDNTRNKKERRHKPSTKKYKLTEELLTQLLFNEDHRCRQKTLMIDRAARRHMMRKAMLIKSRSCQNLLQKSYKKTSEGHKKNENQSEKKSNCYKLRASKIDVHFKAESRNANKEPVETKPKTCASTKLLNVKQEPKNKVGEHQTTKKVDKQTSVYKSQIFKKIFKTTQKNNTEQILINKINELRETKSTKEVKVTHEAWLAYQKLFANAKTALDNFKIPKINSKDKPKIQPATVQKESNSISLKTLHSKDNIVDDIINSNKNKRLLKSGNDIKIKPVTRNNIVDAETFLPVYSKRLLKQSPSCCVREITPTSETYNFPGQSTTITLPIESSKKTKKNCEVNYLLRDPRNWPVLEELRKEHCVVHPQGLNKKTNHLDV
ncbi:hypothetical protein ABEB36_005414 [Hypothenemus hampei]|uniref:Uncharacterized protein n=1 Tax=Hypothenemus hampei TaxID=57062 RepID=A0ABD1EY57_HYPHA